jgi:hypothetical protein
MEVESCKQSAAPQTSWVCSALLTLASAFSLSPSLSLSLSLSGLAVENVFYSVRIGLQHILQEEGRDLCTWEQPSKLAFAVRYTFPTSLKFGSLFPAKAIEVRRFSSKLGLRSSTGLVPTSVGRLLRKWPIIEQGWRKSRLFIIGWKVRFEVGLRTWQTPYSSVWYTYLL